MTVNLGRYQAPQPYPKVQNVHPDGKLADMLMEGYSGQSSELTTSLQYAYHSLQCENKNREIAEVIRNIFYVETLHMKFLGECICKLGGDPHYTIKHRGKNAYWQASLVDYESSPSKILLTNIEGEKQAVSFYERTSAIVDQPDIARLLSRLAKDELLHVRIFTDLHNRYFQ